MNVKMVVDRIEGDIAVLLIRPDEKHELYWPVSYLPRTVKESDILSINIEVDAAETAAAEDRVRSLLDQLKNRSE